MLITCVGRKGAYADWRPRPGLPLSWLFAKTAAGGALSPTIERYYAIIDTCRDYDIRGEFSCH